MKRLAKTLLCSDWLLESLSQNRPSKKYIVFFSLGLLSVSLVFFTKDKLSLMPSNKEAVSDIEAFLWMLFYPVYLVLIARAVSIFRIALFFTAVLYFYFRFFTFYVLYHSFMILLILFIALFYSITINDFNFIDTIFKRIAMIYFYAQFLIFLYQVKKTRIEGKVPADLS